MILYAGNILSSHGFTPTFIELLTPKLAEHYNIKSVSKKKNQSLRMWDMISTLLKNKNVIKLVMVDSYSMKAFWYTYAIAKICMHYKIPYAPILRGGGYPDRLKQSPGLCKIIFSNSIKNISPSLYLKKYFEDEGYPVEYIPNFIPVKDYKFKARKDVKTRLLWVRSFDRTYNPVLAIEILNKLKKKYPESELCMVGPDKDGTLQKVIDKANEYGISDSLKLTGKLSKKQWITLSEDYDIFINTTDFD
ncbi:MAG: glycosyltransferase, partial [Ignavibacteria bacterium]